MKKNLMYYPNLFKLFYTTSFKDLLQKLKLTQIEADILLFLANNASYNTARDICNIRGLAKSNVSTGLSDLEKRGYVVITNDSTSKKLHRLQLTKEAQPILDQLILQQNECMICLMEGFSQKEKTQICHYIEKINHNIEVALEKQQTERMN